LPYEIANKDGKPYVETVINGAKKQFSPEEISAMVKINNFSLKSKIFY
jgi:hypothetical protein